MGVTTIRFSDLLRGRVKRFSREHDISESAALRLLVAKGLTYERIQERRFGRLAVRVPESYQFGKSDRAAERAETLP